MGVRKNGTPPLEIPSMISPLVGASVFAWVFLVARDMILHSSFIGASCAPLLKFQMRLLGWKLLIADG